ncbi:high mobility group box domain-containing protein, partial [Mycena floridula]
MSAHKSGRIPRPANSFILFRSDVGQSLPGTNGRDISRVAAEKWNTSPESIKASYSKRAQEEKAKHAIMYPDYQYRP